MSMDFNDDVAVVGLALLAGEVVVPLGRANQAECDHRRKRLHQAALAQPEPIEILTLPDGSSGDVCLKVRRFK